MNDLDESIGIKLRISELSADTIINWLGLSAEDILEAVGDADIAMMIVGDDDVDESAATLVEDYPDDIAPLLAKVYFDDLYDYLLEIYSMNNDDE